MVYVYSLYLQFEGIFVKNENKNLYKQTRNVFAAGQTRIVNYIITSYWLLLNII